MLISKRLKFLFKIYIFLTGFYIFIGLLFAIPKGDGFQYFVSIVAFILAISSLVLAIIDYKKKPNNLLYYEKETKCLLIDTSVKAFVPRQVKKSDDSKYYIISLKDIKLLEDDNEINGRPKKSLIIILIIGIAVLFTSYEVAMIYLACLFSYVFYFFSSIRSVNSLRIKYYVESKENTLILTNLKNKNSKQQIIDLLKYTKS